MNIVCHRVDNPTENYSRQLREIYEGNFPAAERKPFEELVDGLKTGRYICMVSTDENDHETIVALSFLMPLPNVTTIFLEYIAVDKSAQGKGVGSKMFSLMTDYFAKHKIADALIWEVEASESDDPDHETNKRIRFYERFGAQILKLTVVYGMPDFEKGEGYVPMVLMQVPITEQPDKAGVHSIIKSIYDTAYPDHQKLKDSILNKLAKL